MEPKGLGGGGGGEGAGRDGVSHEWCGTSLRYGACLANVVVARDVEEVPRFQKASNAVRKTLSLMFEGHCEGMYSPPKNNPLPPIRINAPPPSENQRICGTEWVASRIQWLTSECIPSAGRQ
jgi:hypothetical protein